MQKIVIHRESCRQSQAGVLNVSVKEMDELVGEVYSLMQEHHIPFFEVVTHSRDCPGSAFPMEELEHRLFILEH